MFAVTDSYPAIPFGVYVHVPFCASRCDYCAFATWTDRSHLMEAYADACVGDLRGRYSGGGHPPASSVFFGGGTPSLMPPEALMRVLDAVPRMPDAEVTVECNPDSVSPEALAVYRRHGVNRISLGVQSMRSHVLDSLGRTHAPHNVERAVGLVRDAGFPSFNVDLIFGAEHESTDDWRASVDGVLALEPPHVSAYALTVEPGTPLARRVEGGAAAAPDDDDQAAKYADADRRFAAAGLRWYEISNWARPGHECRHNRLYWRGGDYLGIGCSAHGHTGGRRWWTLRTPERYIRAVERGETPEVAGETIDDATRDRERLMLALRTRDGAVPPTHSADIVRDLVDAGLLVRAGDRVLLTRKGRMLAGDVTLRLLTASPPLRPATLQSLALGTLEC